MKRLSLPLLGGLTALALLADSCKKADEQLLTNAVIVHDPRTCAACCGGLVVNFTDTPYFAGTGAYSIVNDADLHINPNDLPLYVRVSWSAESSGSTGCRPTARIISLEKR